MFAIARSLPVKLFLGVLLLLVVTGCGAQQSGPDTGLGVGDTAPEFALPAVGGGTVALADYVGQNQPALLYFHMAVG